MNLVSETRLKGMWRGAFILTIAAFITKVLSAFYRVPYQNMAGDIGFYIYQQVYPIYGIVLVLATYGYPVVISKMIAECHARNDEEGIAYILRLSFYFLLILGVIGFTILYIGADWIASLMGDPALAWLIEIVSFSFLLFPFLSVLRGYFQGKNNMVPTALSQVIEQFVRVMAILLLLYILLKEGKTIYEAGAGAIFGSLIGGFAAIMFLAAYWLKRRPKQPVGKGENLKWKEIVFSLLLQGFAICITNMMLVLMQFVDSMTLLSLLISNNVQAEAAKVLKGIYDRGQPLIQLGTVIATAFSLVLVPLISRERQLGNETLVREKVRLSFRISMVVGLGAALGLACIVRPTNIMLFEDNLGSLELIVLGGSILFTSASLTIAAIFQGMGYQWLPVIGVFIGVLIKGLLNMLLVPLYETVGAALATLIAYIAIFIFFYSQLYAKLDFHLVGKRELLPIVIAALAMVIVLQLYLWGSNELSGFLEEKRLFAASQALVGVVVGGFVYIIMVLRGKVFSKQELSLLPLGEKLTKLLSENKR